MPQPLRRWIPMVFEPEALDHRPKLAIQIAQVSAAWAGVEVSMGLLLAIILDTEARTGVAMYLALTGTAAQRNVLMAAADARLTDELNDSFSSLIDELRNRSGERNRIVHAQWAAPSEYQDALINCSPDNTVRDVAEAYGLFLATGLQGATPSQAFVDNLLIYKDQDFTQITVRISALRHNIETFSHRVSEAHAKRQALADALMKRPPRDASEPPQGGSQTKPEEPS